MPDKHRQCSSKSKSIQVRHKMLISNSVATCIALLLALINLLLMEIYQLYLRARVSPNYIIQSPSSLRVRVLRPQTYPWTSPLQPKAPIKQSSSFQSRTNPAGHQTSKQQRAFPPFRHHERRNSPSNCPIRNRARQNRILILARLLYRRRRLGRCQRDPTTPATGTAQGDPFGGSGVPHRI